MGPNKAVIDTILKSLKLSKKILFSHNGTDIHTFKIKRPTESIQSVPRFFFLLVFFVLVLPFIKVESPID